MPYMARTQGYFVPLPDLANTLPSMTSPTQARAPARVAVTLMVGPWTNPPQPEPDPSAGPTPGPAYPHCALTYCPWVPG